MITLIKNFTVQLRTDSFLRKTIIAGFYIAPFILLVPALLWHLGLMPTLGDEAIRALVALEFLYKNDYITPTINAELYFKKPPVFNWVLLLFFDWGGKATEFFIRLPAVISLLFYSVIIFFTQRKSLGDKWAFVSAFAFITCGRMLFYDSMLGHIDLLFSLTVYSALILVWHYYKANKDYHLFILSYLLIAIAFLMKGFPSIVFLIGTFAGILILERKFKRFISFPHLLGIVIFFIIVGLYFYVYSLRNNVADFFKTLWSESSQRTVLENSWWDSVSFFFYFPLEYFMQLMPWTLFVVMLIRKDARKIVQQNPWVVFSVLVIIANIPVYWLSPMTRPRYLFPLIPFLFHVLIYFYTSPGAVVQKKITEVVLTIAFFVFAIASLLPLFVKIPVVIPGLLLKTFLFFVPIAFLTYLSFRFKEQKAVLLISTLLIARLEFDAFVLPVRAFESPEANDRMSLLKAIKEIGNEPVYFQQDLYLKNCISYYLTREKHKIIHKYTPAENEYLYKGMRHSIDLNNAIFIIDESEFNDKKYSKVADFITDNHHYFFVRKISDQ